MEGSEPNVSIPIGTYDNSCLLLQMFLRHFSDCGPMRSDSLRLKVQIMMLETEHIRVPNILAIQSTDIVCFSWVHHFATSGLIWLMLDAKIFEAF